MVYECGGREPRYSLLAGTSRSISMLKSWTANKSSEERRPPLSDLSREVLDKRFGYWFWSLVSIFWSIFPISSWNDTCSWIYMYCLVFYCLLPYYEIILKKWLQNINTLQFKSLEWWPSGKAYSYYWPGISCVWPRPVCVFLPTFLELWLPFLDPWPGIKNR